jgi:signal transduction histidine kinase/CheY-like chemotaxis protein
MSNEVSCKVLQSIIGDVERQNGDLNLLLENTGLDIAYLKKTSNHITWAQYKLMMSNLTLNLHYQRDDLIKIGQDLFETAPVKVLGVVARTLYTLPEFYLWFHNQDKENLSKQWINCVLLEAHHDDEYNFVIRLLLQNEAEAVPEFYLTSLGVMKSWPMLYGLKQVEVDMTMLPNGCEYRFKCPQSGGILSALRKVIMWPFTARDSANLIVSANNEIYEQKLQLEIENKQLLNAQTALKEAVKKAEMASNVKSNFISNISHEIRTPLNAIIGLNSLILTSVQERNTIENHRTIKHSAENLLHTFEDIIDFSLLGDQRIMLKPEVANASEKLKELAEVFQQKANNTGLTLDINIDPILDQNFDLDWQRLKQILRNILSNAIKFTEQGTVSFHADLLGDHINFWIEDTGIGINKDQLDDVFKPLTQLDDRLSKKNTGVGLGLPLAKALCDLMQGELRYVSRDKPGSLFVISVPVVLAKHQKAIAVNAHKLHILLAEDNRVNQIVIQRMAEKIGHDVTVVSNGKLAVDASKRESFDLVLMDIMMPVMDGLEATKLIRQEYDDVQLPIVVVSANITMNDESRLKEIGVNECITKPVNLETFSSVLKKYPKITS